MSSPEAARRAFPKARVMFRAATARNYESQNKKDLFVMQPHQNQGGIRDVDLRPQSMQFSC
jgi:hypothetical protein